MPRHDEDGPVELPPGKIIGKRWKIKDKLGEGGCGAVYLVEDTKNNAKAAMKAESNFVAGGSVLKLEVQVLKRLNGRKYVAQLIAAGKKEKYSYMVMTVFGPSLSALFKKCRKRFTVPTQVRLGIQILYGLKQLHESGYIHRDIKPANLAIGRRGREARIVHLLDFGLSREFIIRNSDGKAELRRARENCLFRGTTKYCSLKTHERFEQGRSDDLWSMMYVLCEMRSALPWDTLRDKKEIGKKKAETKNEDLIKNDTPKEFLKIMEHVTTVKYEDRPDYFMVYQIFIAIMKEKKIKFIDPYDWELLNQNMNEFPVDKKVKTVAEDPSIEKTGEKSLTGPKTAETKTENEDSDRPLFPIAEFKKNELGF